MADDKIQSSSNNRIELKKEIGLVSGICVIVGSIIGSGIFVSPTAVFLATGSAGSALIIWFSCGIFSMIGAYCYMELGTLIERSGGDYAYVLEAFGPFVAFLRLWADVIVARPVSQAIIALVFAEYALEALYIGCESPPDAKRLLAAVCIVVLTFVNCYSVKWATNVQDVLSYAKVFALIVIIITGIVKLAMGSTSNWAHPFENSSSSPGDYAMAFYAGLFAYNGWNYLNCLIEEMKNPKRDLPLGILISMIMIIVIYVMTNVSYFTILTPTEIIDTKAVAVTIAIRLYGVMWWIMPIFVALSTFGGVNGNLLTTSRIFFVAAQENQMPQVLAMINIKYFTPIPSVLFVSLISLVYLCFSNVSTLINYMGFCNWLAIGLAVFTVIWFRYKKPDAPRPIRVPLVFPIVYVLASAVLIILSFVGGPYESLMGTAILLTAIPVYWIFVIWKKPEVLQSKLDAATTFLQKLFYIVPSDKKEV